MSVGKQSLTALSVVSSSWSTSLCCKISPLWSGLSALFPEQQRLKILSSSPASLVGPALSASAADGSDLGRRRRFKCHVEVWGFSPTFHLDVQEIPIFVSEGSDETKLEAAMEVRILTVGSQMSCPVLLLWDLSQDRDMTVS